MLGEAEVCLPIFLLFFCFSSEILYMLLKNKIKKTEIEARVRHFVRSQLYRSAVYGMTLRKKKHLDIRTDGLEDAKKSADLSKSIMAGRFSFSGREYKSSTDPFGLAREDTAWQAWCHGFGWLDNLLNTDDPQSLVCARHLIDLWISTYNQWDALSWRADVCAQRIVHWGEWANRICASADTDFQTRFYQTLSQQADFLFRSRFRDLQGWPLLVALSSQVKCTLMLDDYDHHLPKSLQRLSATLDQQILADGGHVARSPAILLDTLALCLNLKSLLQKRGQETPDGLLRAVDRMAPMIRSLRHGDGALALFHGGIERDSAEIDDLLSRSENNGRPISDARHSGFQRLQAADTIVLMDVGLPPDAQVNDHGHAAPLSMEMSYGEERLLVNCGAMLGGEKAWTDALAATMAHSTLCVDDTNCFALNPRGGVNVRDVVITSQRFEENGQILVDARHEAYKDQFGLIFERSAYLNKTGDDLRVEDKVIGTGGERFVISLHLHPDVQVSLLQDSQAALLKLASGSGWHLKVQGAKLDLQESIYVPGPGEMHHTYQLVIKGPLRGNGADVKWRLSKIG